MDALNMIFENYGSERLTRIFKSYWLLLLLIKQAMFSSFMIETNPAALPVNDPERIKKEATVSPAEGDLNALDILRIIVTLSQPDRNNCLETETSTEKPNSQIDLDETI